MEEVIQNGSIDTGSTTQNIVLQGTVSSEWHIYNGLYMYFTSGANLGVMKKITAYNPLTKTVTLESALSSAPAQNDTYDMINLHNNRYPYSIDRQVGDIKISIKNDLDNLMANIRSEYKNDYDCSIKITFQTSSAIGTDGTTPVYGYLDIDIPRCKIDEYTDDISGTDFIPADISLIGLAPTNGDPAIKFTVYSKRAISY
jgi:hypothetical protein